MNPNETVSQKIMVVDDTPANLRLMEDMLSGEGYEVRAFPDGFLALRAAAQEPPDLILLDIMMSGMDGFEVCRRLKLIAELSDVPVIFISALDDTESKLKAFTQGGVDYVSKPFQQEEVLARVRTHIALRCQQVEIKAQRREIQASYDKLLKLEGLRDQLVHMIVHDMRSPLTGILGNADFLAKELQDTGSSELADSAGDIFRASQRLRSMITTLLDISRLEAESMPLEQAMSDVRDIASQAVASISSTYSSRARIIYEPGLHAVRAWCDPAITQRIIENLLGNALKFTPRTGSVELRVEQEPEGVAVYVRDTGPGIPKAYHQRIFEKFGQAEIREENQTGSSGLGLAFCKLATEAQGGVIGVESEPGQGSLFRFTLPMTVA